MNTHTISILIISLYMIVKGFWLYSNYKLAPDISYQLNIAENLYSKGEFVYKTVDNNIISYKKSYDWPPLTPILISSMRHLVPNIIIADFVMRLIILALEVSLLISILYKINLTSRDKVLLSIPLMLYIGHIDRGLTSDYLSAVLVATLIWLVYLSFTRTINLLNLILICTLIVLIPLVKYSSFPIIIAPVLLYLYNHVYGTKLKQSGTSILLVLLSIFVSCTIALQFASKSNIVTYQFPTLNDFVNLLRIDYFWLHFGLDGDRIWKHFSWNIEQHTSIYIPHYHIGQVGTILIAITAFLLFKNKILANKNLLIVIIVFSLIQIGYLALLTLISEPQIGSYGIDKKIWVYIEEARYYNYLTLVIMGCLLVLLLQESKLLYLLITIYISTSTIISFKESRLPILVASYQNTISNLDVVNTLNSNTSLSDKEKGYIKIIHGYRKDSTE